MTNNPFRNALHTFDLLPDALKPAFHTAFNDDWSDLTSNGNPLEHGMDPALHPDEAAETAVSYIIEWAGWMCDEKSDVPALLTEPELSDRYKEDPAETREYFRILADAYDLIPFAEDIESTFAGEHISSGHFLTIEPDEIPLPAKFSIIVEDDDDNPVTYRFSVEDGIVTLD
jgi:hypothetical protein